MEKDLCPQSLLQRLDEVLQSLEWPINKKEVLLLAKYISPDCDAAWYPCVYHPTLGMFLWFEEENGYLASSVFMIGATLRNPEPKLFCVQDGKFASYRIKRDLSFVECTAGSIWFPLYESEEEYEMVMQKKFTVKDGESEFCLIS